ncbi:hypothetical protein [Halonatronum saccharophilum]|uniref:hypothetical protein n=1 Tax=Halonatronum saccharophilum TaxID=150060 RepID=UPI00047F51E4|nr:hypothetical protein [Halonatronum saccharophilum]
MGNRGEAFKQKVENLLELFNEFDKTKEIIKLFSFYLINTNQNYKYNESYLNESIEDFEELLNIILRKRNIIERMIEELKEQKIENLQEVIVDELFLYKNNSTSRDIEIFSEGNFYKVKDKRNIYIECIYQINNDKKTSNHYKFSLKEFEEKEFEEILRIIN